MLGVLSTMWHASNRHASKLELVKRPCSTSDSLLNDQIVGA